MNFRNMLLPPSVRVVNRSTPRRSLVHEELAIQRLQAMDRHAGCLSDPRQKRAADLSL
jgi:hypothetical protein